MFNIGDATRRPATTIGQAIFSTKRSRSSRRSALGALSLGQVDATRRALGEAEAHYGEALRHAEALGRRHLQAAVQAALARTSVLRGEYLAVRRSIHYLRGDFVLAFEAVSDNIRLSQQIAAFAPRAARFRELLERIVVEGGGAPLRFLSRARPPAYTLGPSPDFPMAEHTIARSKQIARAAGASVAFVGAAVLCGGWGLGIGWLKRLDPSFVTMKPNTALALLLSGSSLWLLTGPETARRSRIGRWLGAFVAVVATVSLAEYVFDWNAEIDELLFRDDSTVTYPGRMSGATALGLLLVGTSLAAIDVATRGGGRPAQWMALGALLDAGLATIGYLYGVRALYSLAAYSSVAIHTAVCVGVLALGVLCARPDAGMMWVVTRQTPSSRLSRRMMAAIAILPIVLGWLCLQGELAGLYLTAFGLTMMVSVTITCLAALLWWSSHAWVGFEVAEQQAREALAASEQNLSITLQSIGDAVVTADSEGRITRMNEVAERLTGWSLSEAKGLRVEDVLHFIDERTRADVESPVRRVLREGVMVDLVNHTVLVARDGTEHPIADSGAPIRDPLGATHGVVLVFRDATDERRRQDERIRAIELEAENRRVQAASQLRSEFLANMSHELRTPLNSIIGFSELLHDGHAGQLAARQKEYVHNVLSSGQHLLTLIDHVLDLTKIEAGKMEFRPERFDPAKALEEVARVLQPESSSKGITVETHVDPALGEVVLDAARFKEIVYNYLSNAVKFTPAGGRVMVRATVEDTERIRLDVQDTGIGIAPEAFGRLFVEFQQLDAGAAKRHGGTGLGLALTRRLVEAQGGHVGVTSRPNEGSVFHAILPRYAEPVSTRKAHPSLPAFSGAAAILTMCEGHVLVVDDDQASLALVGAILSRLGFPAVCYLDAARALDSLRVGAPIAVVLDLILKGMDGFEFLERFRRIPACQSVPVIVWTVKDLSGDESRRLRSSAQAVVTKGAGPGVDLMEALRAILPLSKGR